jgi:hypothetical protein
MDDNDMQSNANVQVNWGTFNIPTLVGMFVVFAAVWNLSSTLSTMTARLASVDVENSKLNAEQAEQIRGLRTDISTIPTLTYRLTVAEAGITTANSRIDRQVDAISELRGDIASVKADIGILNEKFDAAFPQKRVDLSDMPPELGPRSTSSIK